MPRHCSYCKAWVHNRRNCPQLHADTQRLYDDKMSQYSQLSESERETTPIPTWDYCRSVKITDKINQHNRERREMRRQERVERERIMRERYRRNAEEANQRRQNVRNLISTSVDTYISTLDPTTANNMRTLIQNEVRFGGHSSYIMPIWNLITSRQNSTAQKAAKVEKAIETTECPICFDDLCETDKMITSCGHQFHSSCMFKHLQRTNTCPCCRGALF